MYVLYCDVETNRTFESQPCEGRVENGVDGRGGVKSSGRDSYSASRIILE